MVVLYYVLFTILLAMPVAAAVSVHTENTLWGVVKSLIIGAIVIHIVGFIIGFVDLGTVTINIPSWLVWN